MCFFYTVFIVLVCVRFVGLQIKINLFFIWFAEHISA